MAPVPPARAASSLLRLGPFAEPVRFTGCDDLIDALRTIVRGWGIAPAPPGQAPAMRVRRTRRGYRRVSTRLNTTALAREKERRTLVEALCGLHGELIDWYVEAHPEHLFIHGAAVRFGPRLVVFPALAKAGKSTLTVHMAAHGHTVFSDDVVPIDTTTARGLALGIVPRLRPPLPPSLGPRFHAFVRARAGHGRSNRLYVTLRGRELAPYGEEAPIGGIVLLERRAGARAMLERIDPADALEKIILQNFARDRPSPLILGTLARITESSACYAMRYARVDSAVAQLERAFGAARRPAAPRSRR